MSTRHKLLLRGLLGFLGISLVVPGVVELFAVLPGNADLMPIGTDGKNQYRALHGMMAGLGVLALWACFDIVHARALVQGLGLIMALLVAARAFSIVVDGVPGPASLLYLLTELTLAIIFLRWPPPV